jgi:hypothetical protein
MNLNHATYKKLVEISQSFGGNFTISIDFLFFIFDSYSYEEKKTMLKYCNIDTRNKQSREKKKKYNKEEPSFEIKLNKLHEDRINKLVKECDKLKTASDALEFLLFVFQNVPKDILEDLLIQYSLENQFFEVEQSQFGNKEENDNPLHVDVEYFFPFEPERYLSYS